jgi:hypothetical protein
MPTITQNTGPQARVDLPAAFANATVQVEQVSETEVRVRVVPAAQAVTFPEEGRKPLSDRDRDRLLELLDNPPAPTESLKRALASARKPADG